MKTKINKSGEKSAGSSPFFPARSSAGFLNIQAKLSVGEPDDQYESEADRIADKVVSQSSVGEHDFFAPSGSSGNSIQEKPLAESVTPMIQMEEKKEEEKPVQKQAEEEEEPIQMRKAPDQTGNLDTDTEEFIESERGNGRNLDGKVRSQMENGFGTSFSGVKIHTDHAAVGLNNQLGAQAFTTGSDIYFNSDKYNPETKKGQKLLAHELTHTIQQGAISTQNGQNAVQRWPWDSEPEVTTDLTPEEQLEEDKREFRDQNYGPITYTRSEISGSGFEASYFPARESLNIEVRGKIRFADTVVDNGGTFSSPNHFMNQGGFLPVMNALPASVQSRILPYFQWTEDEKQIHLVRFTENIEAAEDIWAGAGLSFQVSETGWEDVTATPNINVDITEGDAVHNTTEGGLFDLFTVTDEGTSDHLQVEIVKQPTAAEVASVMQIIQEYDDSFGDTFESGIAQGIGPYINHVLGVYSSVDNGMVQGVRSYLGNDPGARGSNPEGFNNFMSLESDRSDNPEDTYYYESVMFGHDESTMSEEASSTLDSFLSDPIVLLNNDERAVNVNLQGHASAAGSTEYNRSLVEDRLNSVESYISDHISNSNITTAITNTRENFDDQDAEAALVSNPETDQANYRRVDVEVEREGRGGQNVFAHELGHVFGLGDEYVETANGYNRPAGSQATHHQLAIDAGVAGGALVANDQRMMSGGNQVGAAHYSTFADALNQLTSKSWRIV